MKPRTVHKAAKSDAQTSPRAAGAPWLAAALVALAVVIVHWPALSSTVVNFDDNEYLVNNPLVRHPSWASVRRFFAEVLEPSTVPGYYQPLNMTSLMLDVAAGGSPEHLTPFRRTSLALHALNTALIVLLLYRLTGHVWAATALGLLFGLHPVTVETLPMVGERKTLLATCFALLSLLAYVRYARRPRWTMYVATALLYVLALLAKPTIVPLPVLLLVLDWWPLGRLNRRAIIEKVPLLALAVLGAAVTYISQARTAKVIVPGQSSWSDVPLGYAYDVGLYARDLFCPVSLSPYYPRPTSLALSSGWVIAGLSVAAVGLALALASLRRTRALVAGLALAALAILPTMPNVRFSDAIAADKYLYFPTLGLLLAGAAGARWLCTRGRGAQRATLAVVGVLALGAAVGTRVYLREWRDSTTLFRYTLTRWPDAWRIQKALGFELARLGDAPGAAAALRAALVRAPWDGDAHNVLGGVLAGTNDLNGAVEHLREAVRLLPRDAYPPFNLALLLEGLGRPAEALPLYERAAQLDPTFVEARQRAAALRNRPAP
jgi:tetratricopeptide (TPR) repeat protein